MPNAFRRKDRAKHYLERPANVAQYNKLLSGLVAKQLQAVEGNPRFQSHVLRKRPQRKRRR